MGMSVPYLVLAIMARHACLSRTAGTKEGGDPSLGSRSRSIFSERGRITHSYHQRSNSVAVYREKMTAGPEMKMELRVRGSKQRQYLHVCSR